MNVLLEVRNDANDTTQEFVLNNDVEEYELTDLRPSKFLLEYTSQETCDDIRFSLFILLLVHWPLVTFVEIAFNAGVTYKIRAIPITDYGRTPKSYIESKRNRFIWFQYIPKVANNDDQSGQDDADALLRPPILNLQPLKTQNEVDPWLS